MIGMHVPKVVFKTRVRDESVGGPNPYRWQDVSTRGALRGQARRRILPTWRLHAGVCTTSQCPAYEERYDELRALDIDAVYCIERERRLRHVPMGEAYYRSPRRNCCRMAPDISRDGMGMLVNKDHLGFGYRSWRYSMVVADLVIEKFFCEPGINDTGSDDDPYTVTAPEVMMEYLRARFDQTTRAASIVGDHD